MENQTSLDRENGYYTREKGPFAAFIPKGANVILDLGCAAGRLGRKLREAGKAAELVGVEIYAPAAEEAAKHYDKVYQDDVECLTLNYKEYFDFVICGDILEHLRDPWAVVSKIHGWLKAGGFFLSSIPNIRHWRVMRDLIIFGKWEYAEAGILDKTHLRFFTRRTFLNMLEKAMFNIHHHEIWIGGPKQEFCNKLTFGIFEEFFGSQIMVLAKKKE